MPNDLSVTEKLAAHTPGPWSVERSIAGKTVITGPGGAHTLAVVNVTFDGAGGLSSLDANARLIASSPELLDAAKAMLAQFEAGGFVRNTDSDGCSDWALQAAGPLRDLALLKAAVVKAEGGAQ